MVDPTKGVGGVQNTLPASKTSQNNQTKEKSSAGAGSGPVDEVSISQEALSLKEAEDTARQARAQLEKSNQSLSRAGDLEGFLA